MTRQWLTEVEMRAQPSIWRAWKSEMLDEAGAVRAWIRGRKPDEIWLCGAGSSAFIGDTLACFLNCLIDRIPVRAVPSTDLVACPDIYLRPGLRPLVVSFGRSGNSSETIGTLSILDRRVPDADRLHISCNKGGTLVTWPHPGPGEQKIIVLPARCGDVGFAMTSSFTTMLLTALSNLSTVPLEQVGETVDVLADAADRLLSDNLAMPRPERAVFLGSGPLAGIARESALKVLELTAGSVVTSWDSTLGFRHGPKAIVNDETAVFVYLSGDRLTRRYDEDVVSEIRTQFPRSNVVSIGGELPGCPPADIAVDGHADDVWNAALFVLVAQKLAVDWSINLGLNVDNPFVCGTLTRTVSNVQLYA